MTAFYSLAKCLFYRRAFHRDTFNILFFLRLHVLSKGKKIIYRMSEILLAAEIAFGCLHRCMAQQELNLLQLAAARVAQLRTGSPQVVRCNMLQAALSQHVFTTYHTTFCEIPFPHTFPALATARKILPSVTPAARIH